MPGRKSRYPNYRGLLARSAADWLALIDALPLSVPAKSQVASIVWWDFCDKSDDARGFTAAFEDWLELGADSDAAVDEVRRGLLMLDYGDYMAEGRAVDPTTRQLGPRPGRQRAPYHRSLHPAIRRRKSA